MTQIESPVHGSDQHDSYCDDILFGILGDSARRRYNR